MRAHEERDAQIQRVQAEAELMLQQARPEIEHERMMLRQQPKAM